MGNTWPSEWVTTRTAFILGLLITVAVIGAYHYDTGAANTSTVYHLVKSGLLLRGQEAVVPCIGFNSATCPSGSNATLAHVQLIQYGGQYYYLSNYTEQPSGYSSECNNGVCTTMTPSASSYTVWFTNSTVFCISPAHPFTNTEHQNRTCPTSPYLPKIITIPTPSASVLNSTLGLRLHLDLSSNSSGAIAVTVDESNTLGHVNNVTAGDRWPTDASNFFLWIQGGCGVPANAPIGYEILQGNYSEGNIKTGIPLTVEAQFGSLLCPYEGPTLYYNFESLSNVAKTYVANGANAGYENDTIDTSCQWTSSSPCWWGGLGTWSGYWVGSTQQNGAGTVIGGACPGQPSTIPVQIASSGCPLTFNEFPPGIYTVVAADEWGQLVLLHFALS